LGKIFEMIKFEKINLNFDKERFYVLFGSLFLIVAFKGVLVKSILVVPDSLALEQFILRGE